MLRRFAHLDSLPVLKELQHLQESSPELRTGGSPSVARAPCDSQETQPEVSPTTVRAEQKELVDTFNDSENDDLEDTNSDEESVVEN
jgi:hypothetical protein